MFLKRSHFFIITALLAILSIGLCVSILFINLNFFKNSSGPKSASQAATGAQPELANTWESYKKRFIEADGRTLDPGRGNITTSEGQAYTLLRAVWQNDRGTFDQALAWTDRNLKVRGDNLFASLWGRNQVGEWVVLDRDTNSGADQDIAFALLMAAQRWPEGAESYRAPALALLSDLWNKEVITIGDKPYLTAGNWAVPQSRLTFNPGYFAPYAYRLFARFDPNPAHRWKALLDSSFAMLYGCTGLNEPSRLPPDWCGYDAGKNRFAAPLNNLSASYGYQGFKVYWRLALDQQWYGPEDSRSLDFLRWSSAGQNPLVTNLADPAAEYDRSGKAVAPYDSATLAGALGLLLNTNPEAATALYQKLLKTYHNLDNGAYYFWDEPDNYYQQNWLWLGIALYNKALQTG
jgi:endoglucanase